MRKKVTVVGGGFVGSTTAQRIVDLELADVVLTDILDGPPAGKALDMVESTSITGSDARVTGISTASGDYKETANSDIVVVTAGFPRKPGMSRDDLLKANYDVINPSSVMLSGVMMFDFMGWQEVGRLIQTGIERTIGQKRVTYDLERMMEGATKLGTSQFASAIIENMQSLAVAK